MRLLPLTCWILSLGLVPGLALSATGAEVAAEAADPPAAPVLLVHGVAWELEWEDATWGRLRRDAAGKARWSGMIGYLDSKGLRYGGTIRPKDGSLTLPEQLHTAGAGVEPGEARLFVLKFSRVANTDGLGYKALELAESIRQLCRLTGAEKVRILAHSAGGVVARVYLQNALPGVPYRGDVERLVTIGTPHLGSAFAHHFGDFLGTRATSIQPDAALIRDLNGKRDLPADVLFASIVVRGIAADARGEGREFDHLIDHDLLRRLPVEYRLGGDQVVHVRSQNLRLAECAARYEQATGRPIVYMPAPVPDPTPKDRPLKDLTDIRVHVAAPYNDVVRQLAFGLLRDQSVFWEKAAPKHFAEWCDWQARIHARGVIESEAIAMHPMSNVKSVRIEQFELLGNHEGRRQYRFAGKAWSKNVAVPLRRRWTHVRGNLWLTFDAFGRVVDTESVIQERNDD